MGIEDKKMARQIQRELARRGDLDFSEAKVSVARYVGYIAGVIHPQPGMTIMNRKEELKIIHDLAMRVPGLRDVVIEATLDDGIKKHA